jgi:hypothetical protein
MAQIPVTVVFSATGQVSLQQGSAALNRLGQQIQTLSTHAGSQGRVLQLLNQDINRFSSVLRSNLGGALNFANQMFGNLYSILGRIARYSFYALIGEVSALSFAFLKLGKEFININERFGELEVVLKSVYGSARAARQLRDEIAKITIVSPLPFKDIATTVRAYSAIPALSSQIGRQIGSGTVGDMQGFFRRAVSLTEQLTTFRPDKLASDAVFAIREAVTGELRSLVRRFEFPTSLLVTASGRSLTELKKRPVEMFNAIKKAMDNIISPGAVIEISKQPKVLFQNIVEQVLQIPLFLVGKYGEDSGKSFYSRFLSYFYNVLQQSGSFISERFNPIAKRLSDALNKSFDSVLAIYGRVSEQFLDFLKLGKSDLPGRGQLERVFLGITKVFEYAANNLPHFADMAESAIRRMIPVVESLVGLFTKIAKILFALFEKSAGLGLAGVGALLTAPTLARGISGFALNRLAIPAMQGTRASLLGAFVNTGPTTTRFTPPLSYAQAAANVAAAGAAGGLVPRIAAWTGLRTGALAAGVGASATTAGSIAAGVGAGVAGIAAIVAPVLITAAVVAAGYYLYDKYSTYAASKAATAGAANLRALGLTPELQAQREKILQRAGGLQTGIEAIKGGLRPYQQAELEKRLAGVEVTFPTGIVREDRTMRGAIQFRDETKTAKLTVDAFIQKLVDYNTDLASLTKALEDNQIDEGEVKLITMPEVKVTLLSQASGLAATIRRFVEQPGVILEQYQKIVSDYTGKTPDISAQLQGKALQNFESAKQMFANLSSNQGLLDELLKTESGDELNTSISQLQNLLKGFGTFGETTSNYLEGWTTQISRIRKAEEMYKTNSQIPIAGLTSKSDEIIHALIVEQKPFFELTDTWKEEATRIQNLNAGLKKANDALNVVLSGGQTDAILRQLTADAQTQIDLLEKDQAEHGPNADRTKAISNYREQIKTLPVKLQSYLEQLVVKYQGSIQSSITSATTAAFVNLPVLLKGFETQLQPERARGVAAFSDLAEQMADVFKGTGELEKVSDLFKKVGLQLKALPAIESAFSPEEAEFLSAKAAKGVRDSVTTFYDEFIKVISVLPDSMQEDIKSRLGGIKTVGEHFARAVADMDGLAVQIINQIRNERKAAALQLFESGEVLPATGVLQRQLLLRDAARAEQRARDTGAPVAPGLLGYSATAGRNLGFAPDNLRYQRQYAEGQERFLGADLASRQRQMDQLGADAIATGVPSPAAVKFSEQLQSEYEKIQATYARIQADLERRNRSMFQTFADGFLAVFDNLRERMRDFTDIGRTLGTSITEGVGGAFADAALKVKSLGQAFEDFGQQLLATATKLFINKAIENIFGLLLGGGTGNIFSTLLSGIGGGGNSAQRGVLGGGQGSAGFSMTRAGGGIIPGLPSSRDNRIISAATGEYIIPADAVSRLGTSHFDAYRRGGVPTLPVKISGFSSGGAVGSPFIAGGGFSSSSQSISTNVPVVVNVEINDKGQVTTKEEAAQRSSMMARGLKIAIQDEILRQHRQGGIYKKNLVSR